VQPVTANRTSSTAAGCPLLEEAALLAPIGEHLVVGNTLQGGVGDLDGGMLDLRWEPGVVSLRVLPLLDRVTHEQAQQWRSRVFLSSGNRSERRLELVIDTEGDVLSATAVPIQVLAMRDTEMRARLAPASARVPLVVTGPFSASDRARPQRGLRLQSRTAAGVGLRRTAATCCS
jgi:hypothetical protein